MQSKGTEKEKAKNKPQKIGFNNLLTRFSEQASLYVESLKKDRQLFLITGCILALLVTGVLIIVISGSQPDHSVQALSEPPGNQGSSGETDTVEIAEVLPQQRRSEGTMQDGAWVPVNQYHDPFAEPIKLTGVAIGGTGGPMAIIESGGSSFIVGVGDYVDDLWAVLEIKREMVLLRAYNQEVSLFLDQPPQTRTLDPVEGEESQEGS